MHWIFDSHGQARNGLQVIKEIPDHRICLIEGPNGVGKSVAVQLLELIAGKVPAALNSPPVWTSFKENLGNTVVEVSNLSGGRSARIRFTPEEWPTAPPTAVTDAFAEVTIDTVPSTLSAMAALLDVTTIRGDESLQDTVRRHIEQIESHLTQTTSTVRDRANETDEFVARVSSDWVRADPSAVHEHAAQVRMLEERLTSAQDRLQRAEQTASDLTRAMEIVRKVTNADADVQALLARQAAVKKTVEEQTTVIAKLNARAEAAEKTLAAQGGTAADLSRAEKQLRGRQTRLSNQMRDVAKLSSQLRLESDPALVRAELKAAQTAQMQLTQEIDAIDRGRRTQDALRRLIPVLDGTTLATSDEVLMVVDEDRFTGREVRTGFETRRTEIAESPRPEKVVETLAEMDKVKRRIRALTEFRNAIESTQRKAELLEEAEQEHKAAQNKSDGATKAAAALRDIHEKLARAQADLTAAHQESVDLQEKIGLSGVSSATEAKAALADLLTELELEETALDSAQATAAQKLRDAADEVERARQKITAARAIADEARTHISTLRSEVSSSSAYAWLRDALTPQQREALSGEDLQVFAVVRDTILSVTDKLFDTVRQLERWTRLTGALGETKPSKSAAAQLEQEASAALTQALGDSLRHALNTESIRNRVFGGLSVHKLDLQRQMIVLKDEQGHTEDRPMSAFSTGERAFAFTQARITDLPRSTKPNRLLVLDEFGAFISADRMTDLGDFLGTLSDRAEQIVIILPLQVNYEAELDDTRGALRERYLDRVQQLKARNYSAVAL